MLTMVVFYALQRQIPNHSDYIDLYFHFVYYNNYLYKLNHALPQTKFNSCLFHVFFFP